VRLPLHGEIFAVNCNYMVNTNIVISYSRIGVTFMYMGIMYSRNAAWQYIY
jgi:hypothetical protein